MTRDLGTALGIAAATLVFTVAAWADSTTAMTSADAARGASVTAATLAVLTLTAAVITALPADDRRSRR